MSHRGEELVPNSCDFSLKESNNTDITEDGHFPLDRSIQGTEVDDDKAKQDLASLNFRPLSLSTP